MLNITIKTMIESMKIKLHHPKDLGTCRWPTSGDSGGCNHNNILHFQLGRGNLRTTTPLLFPVRFWIFIRIMILTVQVNYNLFRLSRGFFLKALGCICDFSRYFSLARALFSAAQVFFLAVSLSLFSWSNRRLTTSCTETNFAFDSTFLLRVFAWSTAEVAFWCRVRFTIASIILSAVAWAAAFTSFSTN